MAEGATDTATLEHTRARRRGSRTRGHVARGINATRARLARDGDTPLALHVIGRRMTRASLARAWPHPDLLLSRDDEQLDIASRVARDATADARRRDGSSPTTAGARAVGTSVLELERPRALLQGPWPRGARRRRRAARARARDREQQRRSAAERSHPITRRQGARQGSRRERGTRWSASRRPARRQGLGFAFKRPSVGPRRVRARGGRAADRRPRAAARRRLWLERGSTVADRPQRLAQTTLIAAWWARELDAGSCARHGSSLLSQHARSSTRPRT